MGGVRQKDGHHQPPGVSVCVCVCAFCVPYNYRIQACEACRCVCVGWWVGVHVLQREVRAKKMATYGCVCSVCGLCVCGGGSS